MGYKMVWLEPHFLQQGKRVPRMFTGWTWEVLRGKPSQEGAHADAEFSILWRQGWRTIMENAWQGEGHWRRGVRQQSRGRCLSWGQIRQVARLPATRDACHTIFMNPKLSCLSFLLKAFQSLPLHEDCEWKASACRPRLSCVRFNTLISWLLSFSSFVPSTPSPVCSWRVSTLPHSLDIDIYNFLSQKRSASI